MLRGINRNWKIPLSYNFCQSATSAMQLTKCIKKLIQLVTVCGFKVVATVCDQGQNNASCIRTLLHETKLTCIKDNTPFCNRIQLSGQFINPLFDPPHLIKGIRNNLLTKNIEVIFPNSEKKRKNDENFNKIRPFLVSPDCIEEIEKKCGTSKDSEKRYFASWDIIELAYDIDTKSINCIKKQMPKLQDGYIRKNKIRKMKVQGAVEILSRTVASFIRHLTCITGAVQTVEGDKSIPIKNGVITSEILKFFNDVFDSLNGCKTESKKTKNVLRREVSLRSCYSLF